MTLAGRFNFQNQNPVANGVGIFAILCFIGSLTLILMGLSEESYSIDEGHDATNMLCNVYNEPRNIHYIKLQPAKASSGADADKRSDDVDAKICKAAGCAPVDAVTTGNSLAAMKCHLPGLSTSECGITVNGYKHDGKYFNLGFSKIAGLEADFQACKDKARYDYNFNQGYLALTFTMVIVYFVYTVLHVFMEPEGGFTDGFDFWQNNTWLLFLTEFMSLFLLLPYFVASRAALPDAVYHEEHKKLENNPSALIFAGWVLLVFYIATHATLQGKSLHGVFSQPIGAGSDNASGKSKAAKNRKVTSIHW